MSELKLIISRGPTICYANFIQYIFTERMIHNIDGSVLKFYEFNKPEYFNSNDIFSNKDVFLYIDDISREKMYGYVFDFNTDENSFKYIIQQLSLRKHNYDCNNSVTLRASLVNNECIYESEPIKLEDGNNTEIDKRRLKEDVLRDFVSEYAELLFV